MYPRCVFRIFDDLQTWKVVALITPTEKMRQIFGHNSKTLNCSRNQEALATIPATKAFHAKFGLGGGGVYRRDLPP